MSVYRDTVGTVSFTHPVGTALSVTATSESGNATNLGTATLAGTTYTVNLPFSLTQYDGKYKLTWSDGAGFSRNTSVNVVTPIVDIPTLRTAWDDGSNPSDAQVGEVEAVVRSVIQTYTGQSFGYSVGSKSYTGNGSGKLLLRDRCNNLRGVLGGWSFLPADYVNPQGATNLNGELNLDRAAITQDGWVMLIEWPEFLTTRESPPMELIDSAPSQDGTIRVPRRFYSNKDVGTHYAVYGEWGYDTVPEAVQEAAMLLANDYLTGDSGYRDRYLQILKIQQDSFTYHPGAFRGTGNARVDLLLGPYRRQNGMIIL